MTDLKEELNAVFADAAQRSGYTNSDDLMALMILEVRKLRAVIESQQKTVSVSQALKGGSLDVQLNGAFRSLDGPVACAASAAPRGDSETGKLRIQYPADKKISVIKAIRTAMGLGLKEAKDLSEGTFYESDPHTVAALNYEFKREGIAARAYLIEM